VNLESTKDADIEAVIEVAQQAVEPAAVEAGGLYVIRRGDGGTELLDLTGDQYQPLPRRKRGTVTVRTVDSFATYWAKHRDAGSEVYADRDRINITAVLDAHQGDPAGARWEDHRLILQLRHTDAWNAWTKYNGQTMPQAAFAEFLEDWRHLIRTPDAATMLELAQSFEATTKASFAGGTRLQSGQRQLSYVEDTTASGGKGTIPIPDTITLAIPVFEGATHADELVARFRYHVDRDGHLTLGYRLNQPTDVLDAAFESVVAEVAERVQLDVLRGVPIQLLF
jgi:uncharacterized protein YfdQ (DUF2303 family)